MPNVLVAYASKRGSTQEIAEAVADTMREHGLSVDCMRAEDVKGLDGFDAVVLGSAVYMRRWRGDAKYFLRKHRIELAHRPFWVFSSGPVGHPPKATEAAVRWAEPPQMMKEAEELGVRDHVVFGGRLPANPRGPIERAMVKNTPPEFHDMRDWSEISSWLERSRRGASRCRSRPVMHRTRSRFVLVTIRPTPSDRRTPHPKSALTRIRGDIARDTVAPCQVRSLAERAIPRGRQRIAPAARGGSSGCAPRQRVNDLRSAA